MFVQMIFQSLRVADLLLDNDRHKSLNEQLLSQIRGLSEIQQRAQPLEDQLKKSLSDTEAKATELARLKDDNGRMSAQVATLLAHLAELENKNSTLNLDLRHALAANVDLKAIADACSHDAQEMSKVCSFLFCNDIEKAFPTGGSEGSCCCDPIVGREE